MNSVKAKFLKLMNPLNLGLFLQIRLSDKIALIFISFRQLPVILSG